MRLLIGESGATKTDWAWIRNGKPIFLASSGLHPAWLDEEQAEAELKQIFQGVDPLHIVFYGAGCYSETSSRPVRQLLGRLFGEVPVEVHDDLTAVAHAFLEEEEGVAGILGTGSNSGLFRNGSKLRQVPALGYILGDEGSAADIGKRILRAALREEFAGEAADHIRTRLGTLDYPVVVGEFYSAKRPSYYLAQVTEKILSGNYPDEIRRVVEECFQSWVDSHLKKYKGFPEIRVVVSGGVAVHQHDLLEGVLRRNGVENLQISAEMIPALARQRVQKFTAGS